MTKSLRVLALAGLAVASVASHAATFIFDFSSKGSFVLSSGTYYVVDTVLPGAGADFSTSPVSGLSYSYVDAAVTTGGGTITLVDASTIDFVFSGGITSNNPNNNALNGTVVTFANGTGTLTGYIGTGSISNTLRWQGSGEQGGSRTTFYAELNPVPEPASMAALALGVAAMARKRRK